MTTTSNSEKGRPSSGVNDMKAVLGHRYRLEETTEAMADLEADLAREKSVIVVGGVS